MGILNCGRKSSPVNTPPQITTTTEMEDIAIIENMDFKETMHLLMHQEKKSRNDKDFEENERILKQIVEHCVRHMQWNSLAECVVFVIRKHSCIQSPAQKFIKQIIDNLENITDKEARYNLIKTLRAACNGKMSLEREFAEVTKILADLYEKDGKLCEGAEILSELKVEAYGLLEPREKVEFILLQMRLLIMCEKHDKAAILSKKIQVKFFTDPEYEDLKIKYYNMKIEMERWTSYLETSRYYRILSICESLSEQERTKMKVNSSIFCALAPKSHDQIVFIGTLLKELCRKTELMVCELLLLLSSKELISVSGVQTAFKAALNKTDIMDLNTRFGKKCFTDLNQRIIEHNILTIANYYSRIKLTRMADLFGTSVNQCEENIAQLVDAGLMTAKIDRFTGIVDFSTPCIRECVLNTWSNNVGELMDCTNKALHHVQKEAMTA